MASVFLSFVVYVFGFVIAIPILAALTCVMDAALRVVGL